MADDTFPPPIEIPWRLAATTQPLVAGEPDETAISLFTFQPDDEALTSLFPDEQLLYLKFAVSVSPAALPPGTPPVAALGEGAPCLHLRLDLKIRKAAGALGTIRPYFHSAAPLHRTMLQTGVVGAEVYTGEREQQATGKSGSQLHESSSSRSITDTVGGGASFGIGGFSVGGSASTSSTSVSADRSVTQFTDSTQRQASEERRELLSHMTRVENLITLLSAKYVGTPHLNFSLSPQPLALLSVDPSDPNLWFSQLLQRRSSGIEGMQEFTTVVLVPRGEDFCVNARLRRVCVLDDPPGPLTFNELFSFNQHLGRLLNYLDRAFPPGTPLEELDVDLSGALPSPDDFARPVLETWVVSPLQLVLASVVSPKAGLPVGLVKRGLVNYKHMLEIWRETLIDEYERNVARSPLERGVLVGEDRMLDTCFAFSAAGAPVVSGSTSSVSALEFVDVDAADFDLGGVTSTASAARSSVRTRALEAATRWNLLEGRLATLLANLRRGPKRRPLRLDDPRLVNLLLRRWSRLGGDDPRNLAFDAAVSALHLDKAQRGQLKAAGASDLAGIAQAILAAPDVERYNVQAKLLQATYEAEKVRGQLPEPIEGALSAKDAELLRQTIGDGLHKDAGQPGRE